MGTDKNIKLHIVTDIKNNNTLPEHDDNIETERGSISLKVSNINLH